MRDSPAAVAPLSPIDRQTAPPVKNPKNSTAAVLVLSAGFPTTDDLAPSGKCGNLVSSEFASHSAESHAMQTEKIITYLAMGVASLICLLFLLDLVAGIFGRNIAMDILFILGGAVPALAGSRDDFRAPLTGVRSSRQAKEWRRTRDQCPLRSAATRSTMARTRPSQV